MLVLLQGEITLRGLRIRRGTHPLAADEDRVLSWTTMRYQSNGPGGRVYVVHDEDGNPIAQWSVPDNRRSITRRVWQRAFKNALRDGHLDVAEHSSGRGEVLVVAGGLMLSLCALLVLVVHHQAKAVGGLANLSVAQLAWSFGGVTLLLAPIVLFVLPVITAPLRCNITWWRLSMSHGIQARLRNGAIERRRWADVRRIRTSGALVHVEFADGLVLRARAAQRSGWLLYDWRERSEPRYRSPSLWWHAFTMVGVMTASLSVAALLPAYRSTGSWQAIPLRVYLLPLVFPVAMLVLLTIRFASYRNAQRRDRLARKREGTARMEPTPSSPANPAG